MGQVIGRDSGVWISKAASWLKRTVATAVAFAALVGAGGAVCAQPIETDVPPTASARDRFGVDLISGKMMNVYTSISIGPDGPGGLAYNVGTTNAVQTELFGFVDDNNPTTGKYTVTIGGASETFTLTGTLGTGTFTNDRGGRATLVYDSGTARFTYTRGDAAVAVFSTNVAPSATAAMPYILSLTYPAGEKITYSYRLIPPTTGYPNGYYAVKTVSTNLGFQLRYTHVLGANGYYRVSKVVLFNMAHESCDPDAESCTLTGTWPSYTFDGAGKTTDTANASYQWTNGTTGNTVTITYPSNRSIVYTRDSYDRVTSVFDGSTTWTYSYPNPYGGVTIANNPDGGTPRVVQYTAEGLITSDMSSNVTTSYTYDAQKRISIVKITQNSSVLETRYTYDARGNVTQTRRISTTPGTPADVYTSASYPATCTNIKTCNKPTYTIDARGNQTDYTYDPLHGGLVTMTLPAGANGVRPQNRYTYTSVAANFRNGSGVTVSGAPVYRLTSVSQCLNAVSCTGQAQERKTTIVYGVSDGLMPISTTQASGDNAVVSTATTTYTPLGDAKVTDGPLPGSEDTARNYFNAYGQLVGTIGADPDGTGARLRRASRFTYNVEGQVTLSEIGTATSQGDTAMDSFVSLEQHGTTYDGQGRKVRETFSAGGTTYAVRQYSYTAGGKQRCVAERLNPAAFGSLPASACTLGTAGTQGSDRIARYNYDTNQRLASITSALGTSLEQTQVTRTYGDLGRMLAMTDAKGNKTSYEYDGFGRVLKIFYPDKNTAGVSSASDWEGYTYDAAGNVTQLKQRDGTVLAAEFDALGRRTRKQVVQNGTVIAQTDYSYDARGRMLSAQRGGQTISFGYDALDRLITQTSPLGTVTSTFDAAGNRTRVSWPGNTFSVDYDHNPAGELTAVRETGQTTGVGVLAAFSYDDLGRRTKLQRGNGTASNYGFDPGSRMTGLGLDLAAGTHDQTTTFGYNAADQMTSRSTTNAAYDWTGGYNVTRPYTNNGLNQTTSAGGTTIGYDAGGRVTSSGNDTFQYDAENRLSGATTAIGTASLSYDAVDRLYQTVGSGTTTRFLYDGSKLIAEFDGAGNLLRRYVHSESDDEPLVWYQGSGTADRRWLIADERGSIVAIANASGTATNLNSYDPFGIPANANAGRFQYTGQMWLPEVGLYHYKARAYSPSLGRFMQPDPAGYGDGMNLYAYVGNDPMNGRDPTGLCMNGVQLYWNHTVYTNGVYNADKSFSVPYGAPMCFDQPSYNSMFQFAGYQPPSPTPQVPTEAQVDEIVVTAKRTRRLAGVRIDLNLQFPREQMWIVTTDMRIIHIPTIATKTQDSCGNDLGSNTPTAEGEALLANSDIFAVIHTHPSWNGGFSAWPGAGDYTLAQRYHVYNINPDGAWVLRRGATRGSVPTPLGGSSAPSAPAQMNGNPRRCR
ncbi:MAG TPA: RHS repeat-associated core domain-containing protein [Allosphingosinicella sp.]|jgi:RHS repeat-associated protein